MVEGKKREKERERKNKRKRETKKEKNERRKERGKNEPVSGVDGGGTYMEVDRDWMSRNLLSWP